MKKYLIPNAETAYYFLKKDFKSAYFNNGNNIKLALTQVAKLRELEEGYVETILISYITFLKSIENNK
jgi:hypothetical protein